MERMIQTNTSTPAKTRACENCVHFRPSVKEVQGRGLCVVYSLIRDRRDACRFGFEPRSEPTSK